ncbi:hypothetical protein Tco_1292179 [Tanacetum coccineum]
MEKNKSYDKADYKKKLYDALVESYNIDKDLFASYGEVFSLKMSRDERDKDQDPSARSDRGTKRRKSSKDVEPSRDSRSKEKNQVARAKEPPTSFDELNDTSFDFSAFVMNRLKIPNLTKEILKLSNLTIDEWYALNVAFRMYTRWIVIQRRVEYLQLGVESYQKKLNLTKPDTFRSNLRKRTAYTTYSDSKGVIYKDQMNKNQLLRVDELHKLSDGTLDDVRSAINDIAKGIRMEYLPMRKWSNLDKKRARVMVQDIDKKLYQRRLMRNLKKFVGGRDYRNDLRLLERTI